MWKRILTLSGLIGFLFLTTAFVQAAGGSGPADALWPSGTAAAVGPHSALWYRFDVGGKKAAVTATVDAQGAAGLRLAVYTPDQIQAWQNGDALKAIGAGSANETHDLFWTGVFNTAGTYYAVIYNDSGATVMATVQVTGDSVTTSARSTTSANPVTPTALKNTAAAAGQTLSGKLVFVDASGGNVYTVNGDGTNLQHISFGMDPQWNHAGTQIALARQGPVPGIYVVNADGSNARLLYQTNEPRSPDWSPDDAQIVFSYLAGVKGGGEVTVTFRGKTRTFAKPTQDEWKLGLVQTADASYRDVRTSQYAFTPTWNADGTTIAYNDTEIGLMTTSPTGAESANPFVGDLRVTSATYNPLRLVSPQYSPDGKQIVYMVQQQPTWQIAVANADGSNGRLLTTDDVLADTHYNNVAPVWSPDGKQILFLSNRNGKWEFFLVNADGSNVHQVLKNVTDQITLTYSYGAERMMSWAQ